MENMQRRFEKRAHHINSMNTMPLSLRLAFFPAIPTAFGVYAFLFCIASIPCKFAMGANFKIGGIQTAFYKRLIVAYIVIMTASRQPCRKHCSQHQWHQAFHLHTPSRVNKDLMPPAFECRHARTYVLKVTFCAAFHNPREWQGRDLSRQQCLERFQPCFLAQGVACLSLAVRGMWPQTMQFATSPTSDTKYRRGCGGTRSPA